MKIPFPNNFEPQKPLKIYDYQDTTIIIFAKSLKPNQLSLVNLYQQGIIPPHWQLKEPVVCKPHSFQLSFHEGININVEMGKVSFSYKKKAHSNSLDIIVNNFIAKIISYQFQKFQIVFRRLITFPKGKCSGLNFINNNLLSLEESRIQVNSISPHKIQLNFVYKLENQPLLISVIDTPVIKKKNNYSGLLFRGLINDENTKGLNRNKYHDNHSGSNTISNYPKYLDFFNQIVNSYLL